VHGLRFRPAFFTNLTHEHPDFHKTMTIMPPRKARLFQQSDNAVINLDRRVRAGHTRGRGGPVCPWRSFFDENDEADSWAMRIRV
jgi:UDP-N-acetylmuramyl tripeptide synthase